MQTSYIKGNTLQSLMLVPNKGALTFNAPKVSFSKSSPYGALLQTDGFYLCIHSSCKWSQIMEELCLYFYTLDITQKHLYVLVSKM